MTQAPATGHTWVLVSHALLPNGPADRLASFLRREGLEVGLFAFPLPGGHRFRFTRLWPGDDKPDLNINAQRPVPLWQEAISVIRLTAFALRLRRRTDNSFILIGCDPLAYAEALFIFRLCRVNVKATAVWFVDWSAQRLSGRVSGPLYRWITKYALRHSAVSAAISEEALTAIRQLFAVDLTNDLVVLPNLPLWSGATQFVPWENRPRNVVYLGGLSPVQGVNILLELADSIKQHEITLHIAGDGPSVELIRKATSIHGSNMRFYDLLTDPDDLAAVLNDSRVGLALYDPTYPMHGYIDSLKTKDYLSAGLRVISTRTNDADDDILRHAAFDVTEITNAILTSIDSTLPSSPQSHNLVTSSLQPVAIMITLLEDFTIS